MRCGLTRLRIPLLIFNFHISLFASLITASSHSTQRSPKSSPLTHSMGAHPTSVLPFSVYHIRFVCWGEGRKRWAGGEFGVLLMRSLALGTTTTTNANEIPCAVMVLYFNTHTHTDIVWEFSAWDPQHSPPPSIHPSQVNPQIYA